MTPEQQAAIREAMRDAMFDAMKACGGCGEGCRSLPCPCADQMAAAHLTALEAAGVVLAPIEPTGDMAITGGQLLIDKYRGRHSQEYAAAENVYRLMIAARPQ